MRIAIGVAAVSAAATVAPFAALATIALTQTAAAQSPLDRLIAQCRSYADIAANRQRENLRRRCGRSGPRWSSNRLGHFRFCIVSSPGVRARETAARAAALRNCRRPRFCTREYRPVCGVIRGARRTYGNACEARRAGARIIRPGECRGPGPGGGRHCRLDNARLTVSSQACGPRTLRLNFGRPVLRNGRQVIRELNSGPIGRGHRPWGICNFHTRIQYVCRNGRLRIRQAFRCQQARTGPRAASCRVSN